MPQNVAWSSAAFLASIGVNTHVDQYASSYGNITTVINDLKYLGVGKVRDSMGDPGGVALFKTVAAATGVKFDALLCVSSYSYDSQIADIISLGKLVIAAEGINEGDFTPTLSYNGNSSYAAISAVQAALYTAVKSNPALSGVTVIAPSYGNTDDFVLAANTAAYSDAGNAHQYAGTGNPPGDGISTFLGLSAIVSGNQPVISTEAGYYTGPAHAGTIVAYQNSGVSQLVQAKYILTLLFDNWQRGIYNTYIYELMDEYADPNNVNSEAHFGIFNTDGTPKPAATAIHNLEALLADSGPARNDTFGYQIVGVLSSANSMLLEKSSGVFDLAVWNDVRLSAPLTGIEMAAPLIPITILFGQYVQSVVEYDPIAGTSAILTWNNVASISLTLPDHPVLFEITPFAPARFSLQTFVLPETVASAQSSGNLAGALIANATQSNQNVVGAVTVASVGTTGTQGRVTFDAAAQVVTYTAPTYSPLTPTDSFTYTLVNSRGNTVTGTVAVTETPPPNTLYDTTVGLRIDAPASGWTLVSLASGQSLYGNFDGDTLFGSSDTSMYGSTNGSFTAGDGAHVIGADGGARITLGNGKNTIGLYGAGNVVTTGNGDTLVYTTFGNNKITTGNGNQNITVGGQNNTVTLGIGTSTVNLFTDAAPAGIDRVTVAGGTNAINAVGANAIILVQGGTGNQIVAQGGASTITIEAGSNNVSAGNDSNVITTLSGTNTVNAYGNGNTITLGSGSDSVSVGGNSNRITAGSGFGSISIVGQYNVIDVTHGTTILGAQGTRNAIILAAPGGTAAHIYGDVIAASDTLDLRIALAATNWNGQSSTLGDYLQIRTVGSTSVISIDTDGKGPAAAAEIAVLNNSANLTYAGLVNQSILPTVNAALHLQHSPLAETIAPATPTNLWSAIIANAAGTDLAGNAGLKIVAVGTAGTTGSISLDPANQTLVYTPPPYSPLTPTDAFTYTVSDARGSIVTGTVAVTETPPANTVYDTVAGTRLNAPGSGWTLVSLAAGNSLYGKPDGTGDTFIGAADTDMHGATNATFIAGDGNHVIGAGAGARITLGNGNNTMGLYGGGNVIATGNGNNLVFDTYGNNTITMGNGNQDITVGGQNNTVSLGSGVSTIVLNTDNKPAGINRVTVAGGTNTISAAGTDAIILVQGGSGNQITTHGGASTITLNAGSNTVTARNDSNFITALSGINTLNTIGNGNTIVLGSGTDSVFSVGNSNRMTAGSGLGFINNAGQYNTIDVTKGTDTLTEQGSHNAIILAAAGGATTQVYGDVIAASDYLDLRTALAATNWNGQRSTLDSYLQVRNVGAASFISIDADGKGPGQAADIALLNNSAGLTYAGLLAQSNTGL